MLKLAHHIRPVKLCVPLENLQVEERRAPIDDVKGSIVSKRINKTMPHFSDNEGHVNGVKKPGISFSCRSCHMRVLSYQR
jgi:hypothetical protein